VSKTTENVLLVPGESGWEIWTGQTGADAFTLKAATPHARAADLTDIPNGDLLLFFPVKAITALPMRVTSDDDALFPDLAALHAERLGLRPDPMAGQLTDLFVISREPQNTALVSVQLRTPGEGEMPPRGPKSFDISARAFPLAGEALSLWKELGRWVFSLSHQGNLVYCQATSSSGISPDAALVRDIRLAMMQLSMQDLEIHPSRIVVWSSAEDIDTAALSQAFTARRFYPAHSVSCSLPMSVPLVARLCASATPSSASPPSSLPTSASSAGSAMDFGKTTPRPRSY
jgi:hypothetical protein